MTFERGSKSHQLAHANAGLRMHLRRFLIIVVLLSAYSLYRLPYDQFAQDAVQDALKDLENQGVIASVDKIDIQFPLNVAYKNFKTTLPIKPFGLPISLQEGIVKPKLLSLLLLSSGATHKGIAYDGRLDFDVSRSFSGNSEIDFSLKDANLGKHDLLNMAGASGNISITGSALTEGNLIKEGGVILQLENASLDGKFKLFGFLKVPLLSDLDSFIKASLKDGKVDLNSCKLSSNFGTARCLGNAKLNQYSQLSTADITIKVDLNEQGTKELASYFSLAAGGQTGSVNSAWNIAIKKSPNGPLTSKVSVR